MVKDFSLYPSVRFNRSKFDMPHDVKTSMSVGKLYPISIVDVLPGDTFKCDMSAVARVTSSFIKPIMDNLYMDVYHFYVPLRLLYDKFEQVFGKASPSMYDDGVLEDIPTFANSVMISEGSVGDYLGIGLGTVPSGLSVLPFRAFAKIYNDWFRNENITDEVLIQKGAINSETPNANAWSSSNYTGMLPSVGKKKDYFTSCNLKTQKGAPVQVPLGQFAEVITRNIGDDFSGKTSATLPLKVFSSGSTGSSVTPGGVRLLGVNYGNLQYSTVNNDTIITGEPDGASPLHIDFIGQNAVPVNLWADLSKATASNVNDLRFAFQLQRMLERDALFGSRFNEFLLGHFGVSSPDSRLQFSEYLGGGRIPINVQQVAQTSASSESSPLANVAGYSLTNGFSKFMKGFVEHGYVITVACIRQVHTYQQGVPKLFSRKSRNDFYDPLFANLGEQPVYKSELYANVGNSLRDNTKIFGYAEAWADYRFIPNNITGQLRSTATDSLDIWHLGDVFENAPTLTDNFILENSDNIDRVISVPSSSVDNFICDFYFKTQAIRVMPVFSTPGLIDHH